MNNGYYRTLLILTATVLAGLTSGNLFSADSSTWLPVQNGQSTADPILTVLAETPDHLIIQYNVPGIFIDEVTVDKELFHKLRFKRDLSASRSRSGEPFLPSLNEMIRLPDNTAASVSIVDVKWKYSGRFNVYPRQLPRRYGVSRSREFQYSHSAYSQTDPFPTEQAYIGAVQGWRGIAVAPMTVTPFRYSPDTGRLETAETITIRVDFHPGSGRTVIKPRHPSRRMEHLYQGCLLNPPAKQPHELDFDENEPVRMLVVLKEDALEAAQPLIDFHHQTGLRTEVWLADDIEDEFEIKERVSEMFEDGLEYLFIIGDGHRNHYDVPMHFWDPLDPGWQDPEDPTSSHSDTWYTCLDPPDDDEYEDHLPELSVGRIVYDDIDELELQVAKLMDYLEWNFENEGDWLDRAVFLAHRERYENEYHYINCKRRIEEHEYNLPFPEVTTFYGTEEGATNNAVIAAVNENGFGIFNYRGHGDNNVWPGWSFRREDWQDDEVGELENRDSPFILVSSACYTGNIATHYSNCLIESFQKHENGGSLSAHGSVISTFTSGNNFFEEAIFSAWFDEGIYDIGYAATDAMTEMVNEWANDYYAVIGRMNLRAYIWLGDPALEVKQTAPQEMNVGIPELVPLGTEQINASISIDEEPLEGAVLCVRGNEDDIYVVGESDEEGWLALEFDPALNEPVNLTWMAYHRHGLPATGSVLAMDSTGSVEGIVTSAATEEPLAGAVVQIARFDLEAVTDDNGYYTFRDIAATNHILTAMMEGYLAESAEVTIIEDSVHVVDFALLHSQLEADSAQITMHLEEEESTQRDFNFRNTGDGTLEWSASLDFGGDCEEFELLEEYNFYELTDDRKLNGVEYINGMLYIAGSHGNNEPNYIYVVDPDSFELVQRFDQPEGCAGIGIQDLAWDGEYLYGACQDSIYKLDLEGNLASVFEGPYNPNNALAADDEGNLWVGSNVHQLLKIDTEGNVLDSIPNFLNVRALAWYPASPDNHELFLFVRDEGQHLVLLFEADVNSRRTRFKTDLTDADGQMTGDGLTVSPSFNPNAWTMIGTVIDNPDRIIKAWHLAYSHSWLEIESEAGSVEPDEEGIIALTFTAPPSSDGLRFEAQLFIESNSLANDSIEIPIILEVGEQSAEDEAWSSLPVDFSVGNPYPNPFNARTVVPIALPITGKLVAAVYDLSGRRVFDLANGRFERGRHDLVFSADDLASGVYFILVTYKGQRIVRKMVLMH